MNKKGPKACGVVGVEERHYSPGLFGSKSMLFLPSFQSKMQPCNLPLPQS